MVQAVHTSIKGRARFKVQGLYRSENLKRRLESSLSGREGIHKASANILTGNLFVSYNSDNTPHKITLLILEILTQQQDFTPSFKDVDYHENGNEYGKVQPRSYFELEVHPEINSEDYWHLKGTSDAVSLLKTSPETGLSNDEAIGRLKRYGHNLLSESIPRSGFSLFLDQFKSLPVALLGVAAGVSVITGGIVDAVVIMGVVVINATIGFTTERGAEKTMESLKGMLAPSVQVLRDGNLKTIPAKDVVPGDVLALKPGTFIAADSRLIETHQLYVDESALTGESMPVRKKPEPLFKKDTPLGDRLNMVFMGTLVTGGSGVAVVVATGRLTEMGRIQMLVGEAESPETPMEKQLDRLGSQLVLISGGVCGLVFIIGLLRGYGFLQMLKSSISLAVAAVPEGLPTVATTTLALGIRNMRKHHVLIRHLEAVETLGAVQTICLDKTGTITMNRMTVVVLYTGGLSVQVSDNKFTSEGRSINPFALDELLRLIHVSVLCNETLIDFDKSEYILKGSPTENSLIHMGLAAGVDIVMLRNKYPTIRINHRSENRNFMTTLHSFDKPGVERSSFLMAVKGSPAEVLAMCQWQICNGEQIPMNEEDRQKIQFENEKMSGHALRILGVAFAYSDFSNCDLKSPNSLIWLGLVGMVDPIREGVKDLIGQFHQAGIDTVMITGDQSTTAYAIGKELNLNRGELIEILDSSHLADIGPEVMTALAEKVQVFARVSPANKLQIVQALQKSGKVVAMTGDGINDSPALKAADIGIAMGHGGTDVAREVADVILENDNLETMIIAVSHGRTIYNNIRKSVHFLLATNLSEIMVMLAAISVGIGQPLNAMQLLWINLISDIFPGLALALEPPEPDVLIRPPRNPDEPIIKSSDFKRISFEAAALSAGTLGAYGFGIMKYGIGPRAGTLAFMSLTTGQLLHALSCRSEKRQKLPPNPYLSAAVGGSLALQILVLAVPGVRSLLGITPISLIDGVVIGGSALLPLIVNEATKPAGLLIDASPKKESGLTIQRLQLNEKGAI
ncbi:MAG: HAD-IC family P-type ATPase, partial [Nitrospiria bacterium]